MSSDNNSDSSFQKSKKPKKQVFIQLDNEDDDSQSNQDIAHSEDLPIEYNSIKQSITPEAQNQSQISSAAYNQQTNENEMNEANENEYDDANDLFLRVLQVGIERQESIMGSLGEDLELPLIDPNSNTDEVKDLNIKIRKQAEEIEELQRKLYSCETDSVETKSDGRSQGGGGNSSRLGITHKKNKPVVKQFIILDDVVPGEESKDEMKKSGGTEQLIQEIKDKSEKLRQQEDVITQMEKELYYLKEYKEREEQKNMIRQKSRENFKNKYQLSLSQIEESDHECSYTKIEQISKKLLEDKDALIISLQDRIKMLMANAHIQLNICSNDLVVKNMSYLESPSQANLRIGSLILNKKASSKKLLKQESTLLNKDMLLKGVNQAQIIEELLKKKQNTTVITTNTQNNISFVEDNQFQYEDLFLRMDQLNKDYVEMIKKFKVIEKEKQQLIKVVDDLSRTNQSLENDFKLLFKQVQEFNKKEQRMLRQEPPQREQKSLQINIQHEIQDIDSLLEYIQILFEEKNYLQASKLWQKIEYQDLIQVKSVKNMDYLKIILKLKDQMIAELLKKEPQKDQEPVIGEDKINEIVVKHLKFRNERISTLESKSNDLLQRNDELVLQIDKLQTNIELIVGERDFEKRKNEKYKRDAEVARRELRTFQEVTVAEFSDKYEKEIGLLMNEIRLLKKQNMKLQQDLLVYKGSHQISEAEDAEELRIEELEGSIDPKPLRGTFPTFDSHKKFSEIKSLNQSETEKQIGMDEIDEDTFDQKVKELYSKFFSNEYKHAQDKIRNKNQIFKQLFQLCLAEISRLYDLVKTLNKFNSEKGMHEKKLTQLQEEMRSELEQSHQYALKLIVQKLDNNKNTAKIEELSKLRIIELLKIISQYVKIIQNEIKHYKLSKKQYQTDSERDSEIDKLSKKEALELLKEISNENDALLQRSDSLNQQLELIELKIKEQAKENELLLKNNRDLSQALLKLQTEINSQVGQRSARSTEKNTERNSPQSSKKHIKLVEVRHDSSYKELHRQQNQQLQNMQMQQQVYQQQQQHQLQRQISPEREESTMVMRYDSKDLRYMDSLRTVKNQQPSNQEEMYSTLQQNGYSTQRQNSNNLPPKINPRHLQKHQHYNQMRLRSRGGQDGGLKESQFSFKNQTEYNNSLILTQRNPAFYEKPTISMTPTAMNRSNFTDIFNPINQDSEHLQRTSKFPDEMNMQPDQTRQKKIVALRHHHLPKPSNCSTIHSNDRNNNQYYY